MRSGSEAPRRMSGSEAPRRTPRLRVVLVTRRFWPLVGGAEMVMANLAEAMRQLGAETQIVTAQWERTWPTEVIHREAPVHRIPQPQRRAWGTFVYMRGLTRWLRRHRDQFDAVCVSMLKHSAYVAAGCAAKENFPLLLRAEGGGETGDSHWQQTARLGRRIAKRCQRQTVVAPSQQIVEELTGSGYSQQRVHYVPNGVAVLEPLADRNAARLSLGEANHDLLALDHAPVAAFTGRLSRKKGLFELIAAWRLVVQQHPNAKLWLVGEGDDRDALFQQVKDLELNSRVLLPGAFDDVSEVLQAADIFVLPSHEEGMSLSLLEAMAAGRPVVASDIPGNRAIVSSGVEGLLTPLGDVPKLAEAIIQMFNDPHRGRFGEAGRKLVAEKFSLQQCAAKHLELLESMASVREAAS